VKVFARTSPENKALIVRKHKEKIQLEQSKLTFKERAFKECSYKVGMVGDGANDLIAIKEAHVGIGISSSDAVFSASFAVKELDQILEVIRESKNTERQIVEMTKYYGLTQFTSIVVTLILSTDASYFTSMQLIYKSFLNTLIITLFFGVTQPAKRMTKYLNNSNLVDLENHLVYWLTMVVYSAGLVASYVYYTRSDDFSPNPSPEIRFPEGWNGDTKSSTVNFITSNILYIFLPFAIYRSEPWKLPIWTNKPVMGIIALNFLLLVPLSLLTSHMGFLSLQPISTSDILVIWGIMLVTSAIVLAVNRILERVFFNRMVQEVEGRSAVCREEELKNEG
jgi:cation-transporting ATPase 13A3/4/5